jgi:hypothetical protein
MWVFGKHLEGVEIYIKLRIAEFSDMERAVCVSFHRAEYPLDYPLAED